MYTDKCISVSIFDFERASSEKTIKPTILKFGLKHTEMHKLYKID